MHAQKAAWKKTLYPSRLSASITTSHLYRLSMLQTNVPCFRRLQQKCGIPEKRGETGDLAGSSGSVLEWTSAKTWHPLAWLNGFRLHLPEYPRLSLLNWPLIRLDSGQTQPASA